jgi:hypothetical protein
LSFIQGPFSVAPCLTLTLRPLQVICKEEEGRRGGMGGGVEEEEGGGKEKREVPARLWTSSLQRTISTAALIKHPVLDCGWLQMANRVYRCVRPAPEGGGGANTGHPSAVCLRPEGLDRPGYIPNDVEHVTEVEAHGMRVQQRRSDGCHVHVCLVYRRRHNTCQRATRACA